MEIKDSLTNIILDALSAHIAILDKNGFILKTNLAWQNFADARDHFVLFSMNSVDLYFLKFETP